MVEMILLNCLSSSELPTSDQLQKRKDRVRFWYAQQVDEYLFDTTDKEVLQKWWSPRVLFLYSFSNVLIDARVEEIQGLIAAKDKRLNEGQEVSKKSLLYLERSLDLITNRDKITDALLSARSPHLTLSLIEDPKTPELLYHEYYHDRKTF